MKLIAGKLNNCSTLFYWQIIENEKFEIGDYAIVENMNDYDLVKIVGILETSDKYAKFINDRKLKNVVSIIKRIEIRED